MFGKNPIRKKDRGDGSTLRVQSIFPTIQGEGPFSGVPATFLRLAGCNLACTFCDTDFESNYESGLMQMEEVAAQVHNHKNKLVVLTGGEPLLQNIVPLCFALTLHGHHVQIETAGTIWPDGLEDEVDETANLADALVSVVVSPKTPKLHHQPYTLACAWKYIITGLDAVSNEDGLPIKSTQKPEQGSVLCRPPLALLRTRPDLVFLQPCDFGIPELNKNAQEACVTIARKYGYRISLQTHKLLGVE